MTATAVARRWAAAGRRGAAGVLLLGLLAGCASSSPARTAVGPTTTTAPSGAAPVSSITDAGLAAIADTARKACGSPGAVVGIERSDGHQQVHAAGVFAPGVALRPDSQYFAGSVTKVFVAVLALQAVEHGDLRLTDTVDRFLPWSEGDRITVGMLLSHHSGMGDFGNDFGADLKALVLADLGRVFTYDEVLEQVAAVPRFGPPGGAYHYTNSDTIVLGAILRTVSGHRLGDSMRTQIFEPLHLDHTLYGPDDLGALARVTYHGWFDVNGSGTPVDIGAFPRAAAFTVDPAGSGLVTTAPDTLRFLHALFGTDRLLDASSRAYVANAVSTIAAKDVLLGPTRSVVGHGGAAPGAQVVAAYDQTSGVSTVAWCNRLDPGAQELLPTIVATHSLLRAVHAR